MPNQNSDTQRLGPSSSLSGQTQPPPFPVIGRELAAEDIISLRQGLACSPHIKILAISPRVAFGTVLVDWSPLVLRSHAP